MLSIYARINILKFYAIKNYRLMLHRIKQIVFFVVVVDVYHWKSEYMREKKSVKVCWSSMTRVIYAGERQ